MNPHRYHNVHLGFAIEKPVSWEFVPLECAVNQARLIALRPDQVDLLIEPHKPFVYFHLLHDDENELYPTVQANCRLSNPALTPKQFLDAMVGGLSKSLLEFKLMDSSSEMIGMGVPTTHFRADYLAQAHDGTVSHGIIRGYSLFTKRFTFVITLIGAFAGVYQKELEFQTILQSIQITNN